MAHGNTPHAGVHAESGVSGIVSQYGDRVARTVADWLFTQGWFLQLLGTLSAFSPGAIAGLIRLVFGGLNLGAHTRFGAWVNIFSDKIASEVAEVLETDPDILKRAASGRKMARTKDALIQEGKAAVQGKTFFLLAGMAHASESCVLLLQMQEELHKAGRGKSGKGQQASSSAQPMKTTLPDIMTAQVPLCPTCVASADIEGGASQDSGDAPEKTFFDLLKEFEEDDPDAHAVFWGAFRASEDEVRNKFLHAFGQGGELADLKHIASHPPDEWETLLDAMLGIEQHGTIKALGKAVSGFFRKIAEKTEAEQEETDGTFDVFGKAFEGHAEKLDSKADEYAIRNRLRKERRLRAKLARAKDPEYRRRLEERLAALEPITLTDADMIGEEDSNV